MEADLPRLTAEITTALPDVVVRELLSETVGGTVMLGVKHGRQVVIKRLRHRRGKRRQAQRETDMLQAAQGPHVVRLDEAHQFDNCTLLVMEYLPEPSLRARLSGEWTAADLVMSGLSVAVAVRRLHTQQISFNDLKPRNVGVLGPTQKLKPSGTRTTRPNDLALRDPAVSTGLADVPAPVAWVDTPARSVVKLLDFGHAKSFEDTRSQAFMGGSVDYVPPEFVHQGTPGPWSDVWSWGRSWHLLASGSYFSRRHNVNQLMRYGPVQLPPIHLVSRVRLPTGFATLIDECLAIDPSSRPPDGTDLVRRIEQVIATEWGEMQHVPSQFSCQVD